MAANPLQTQQQSEIKQLITKGKEQGFLTYAEVNDHLPDDIVDPEQLEDIITMINDMGIEVHEEAPDAESLLMNEAAAATDNDDTATEEAVAVLTAVEETGRTTDPVRMYMREMGTVELLTREGEIAIAKRIEEGLNQVQNSLAQFPWSIQILLDEYEQHLDGKKRMSEFLTGFTDMEQAEEPITEEMLKEEVEPVAGAAEESEDGETAVDTGPDPAEVKRRMDLLREYYGKFQAQYKKNGPEDRKTQKVRATMAEEFLKLPQEGPHAAQGLPQGLPRQRDQRPLVRQRGPQEDQVGRAHEGLQGRRAGRAGAPAAAREGAVPVAAGDQGDQPRDVDRRGQGAQGQEGDGRGQPAPRDLDR